VGTVKLICAGHGEQQPYGKNLLAAGQLLPSEVPFYYYAADFFVLPTLAEGCSNAVVEAIGCGLPVISSNMSFNDDILSDEYSIRIDPMNVDELEKAIRTLTLTLN
jgi:glycosyltransferase involved in cell wall biosynthesis